MTKNQKRKTEVVVLYHNNCADGFGAAWAAWKKFGKRAEYIGVNHQESPPRGLRGKDVYCLDFTYPLAITKKLIRQTKLLTILDHHVSVEEATVLAPQYRYALNHSGSVLAWQYFHPAKNVPTLLKYVEDVDLWKFRLPKTHKLAAYLDTYLELSFKPWSAMVSKFENPKIRNQYAHEGSIILRYQNILIENALKNSAELVKFCGHRALAVNSSFIHSEIGNVLATKRGPFSIVWSKKYGKIVVSLRSIGNFDVSKLAARYGGGGHKNAAGFSLSAKEPFPWKAIKMKK